MFFAPALHTRAFSPRVHDRAFQRFVNDAFVSGRRHLDLQEDETSWTLNLDVPGLSRDDLSVAIEGAVVRIQSKAEAKRALKLAYELPLAIDAQNSTARVENGVLSLKLAKALPQSNVSQLQIQ